MLRIPVVLFVVLTCTKYCKLKLFNETRKCRASFAIPFVLNVVLTAIHKVGADAHLVFGVCILKKHHPFPSFFYCTHSYFVLLVFFQLVSFVFLPSFFSAPISKVLTEWKRNLFGDAKYTQATMPASPGDIEVPGAGVHRDVRNVNITLVVSPTPVN